MNKFPRFVCKQFGKLVSINSLLKINTPVFQPFYHVVSNEKLPHILNYNYRTATQFEKELDFYLQHFKPVSLNELISNEFTNEKVFHLSFDDGLKESAEIIAPILLKKGIPATFFINPGFADNKQLFHKYKASLILTRLQKSKASQADQLLKKHDLEGEKILKVTILQNKILDEAAGLLGINFQNFLEDQKPYLTTNQILNMQNQGFSIGVHSINHPEFWKISEQHQLSEVSESMHWLTENIKPAIKAFSFPFTDSGVSLKVLKSLKSENICDVTFGTAGIKSDELQHHFQRYPVEQTGDFLQNLKAELVYFAVRKQIGKATVKH